MEDNIKSSDVFIYICAHQIELLPVAHLSILELLVKHDGTETITSDEYSSRLPRITSCLRINIGRIAGCNILGGGVEGHPLGVWPSLSINLKLGMRSAPLLFDYGIRKGTNNTGELEKR
jgi:hypothetical protein